MTPDRWRRLEALFHSMRAIPAGERTAALAAACADDLALQAEVASLLEQPSAATFLATPDLEMTAQPGAPAATSLTGRRLGVFEVQGLLGVGGMGEVYRARDTRLRREVAIKILPAAFKDDRARVARFEREARVLASLNHPHIGTIYGLEEADDVTALVMELVDGDDLSQRMARGPLAVTEALDVARQIAAAIEAAHQQGVVHRDLKPANIKLRRDGTVKVLDFGLAKALHLPSEEALTRPTNATQPGVVLGTPAYMSPEQARGEEADRQADIWSFGVVLYELLTGISPFARQTTADTLASVLNTQPDVSRLPSELPAGVELLVRRCLEKDRRRRLQHMGDVRLEIDDALTGLAVEATSPATSTPASDAFAARRRLGLLATAVVLLATVATLAYVRLSEQNASAATASAGSRASIAVLPFADLSAAQDQDHLADGMSAELITSIGRIPDLLVTGRESSFRFKGRNEDLETIRKALGVGYLLTGSVQRTAQQIRIKVQLLDAASGFLTWSESYDRRIEDIFAIQDDIARSVAEALGVTLGLGQNSVPGMTRDAAAYEQWLRGNQLFNQLSAESLQAASEHFDRAVHLDPSFSSALVRQFHSYQQLATLTVTQDGGREWNRRAFDTLERARALTPETPDVLDARANVEMNLGNWMEAARLLDRFAAVRGDARPRTLPWDLAAARMVLTSGRLSEAIESFTHGKAVDPLSPFVATFLATAYALTGDSLAALGEFERGLTLGGGENLLRGGAFLTELDARPPSRENILKRVAVLSGPAKSLHVAMVQFLDDPDAGLAEIPRQANTPPGQNTIGQIGLAYWAAFYGGPELALEYLSKAAKRMADPSMLWRPMMRDVRKLPGFKDLVRNLGLVEYWRAYGWPAPHLCRPTTGDDYTCG